MRREVTRRRSTGGAGDDMMRPATAANRSALREADGSLHKELLGAFAARVYDAILAAPGIPVAALAAEVGVPGVISWLDLDRVLDTMAAAGAVRRVRGPTAASARRGDVLLATGRFLDTYEMTDL
jgi:hypothetical protein